MSTPSTPPPPPTASGVPGLWNGIRRWGIRRDADRKWFGGVCAGVADRLGIDPLLVRAAVIAMTILGGFGIAAYVLAWLVLPDQTDRIIAEGWTGGSDTTAVVVLAVLAVLAVGSLAVISDNTGWIGWGVLPVALIAWLLLRDRRGAPPSAPGAPAPPPPSSIVTEETTMSTTYAGPTPEHGAPVNPYARHPAGPPSPGASPPPPPRPRRRRASVWTGLLVVGLALAGYGVGYALDGPAGFRGDAAVLGSVAALVVAAVATLAIGLSGRRSIIAVLTTLVCAVSAPVSTWSPGAAGSLTYRPLPVTGSAITYDVSAGRTTLDLADLVASPGQRVVIDQALGEMVIRVPRGSAVEVACDVSLGSIKVQRLDAGDQGVVDRRGAGTTRTVAFGSSPYAVTVDAELGAGTIIIKEY